ncbi:MAG: helix-turn-helix transcriptional regulator [Hylemonella sp.]|nr:helix-turn-helix transcriptional regulator [Hylemonella sp.]
MKTPITEATMSPEDFSVALHALGWKQSDFCRKSGVTKQTPSRWANGQTPIPAWVPAYLGAMQELKRLYLVYIDPDA